MLARAARAFPTSSLLSVTLPSLRVTGARMGARCYASSGPCLCPKCVGTSGDAIKVSVLFPRGLCAPSARPVHRSSVLLSPQPLAIAKCCMYCTRAVVWRGVRYARGGWEATGCSAVGCTIPLMFFNQGTAQHRVTDIHLTPATPPPPPRAACAPSVAPTTLFPCVVVVGPVARGVAGLLPPQGH